MKKAKPDRRQWPMEKKAAAIRRAYDSGQLTYQELAGAYGLAASTIAKIVHGQIYSEGVDPPACKRKPTPGRPRGPAWDLRKLTPQQEKKVRRAVAQGRTYRDVAQEFGITYQLVGQIVLRGDEPAPVGKR